MFRISICLPIWLPSPYTTGYFQDNNDKSWSLASCLPHWGSNLIIQPLQIQLVLRLYQLVVQIIDYPYSHFYQLNWSIISRFKQTFFCLEKFRLLLQVFIHFTCNSHPLKWQCLLAWSFFLWKNIFAFLATITKILYPIHSKIRLNAALFSTAFWSRYLVD